MAPRECKGPRLFVEGLCDRGAIGSNSLLSLSPKDSHYLKDVLRLPIGAPVEIGDPRTGESFKTSILSLADSVTLTVVERIDTSAPEVSIALLCALCKGAKNELITDWATELGCERIIFWQSERSVVRLTNDEDAEAKALKFSKAALAAAQQSRQVRPPHLHVTTSLEKALSLIPSTSNTRKLCCSLEYEAPHISELLKDLQPGTSVCIVIGPEGDLTPRELASLNANGFTAASLGRQVLRSELAAVTAVISIKNAASSRL